MGQKRDRSFAQPSIHYRRAAGVFCSDKLLDDGQLHDG